MSFQAMLMPVFALVALTFALLFWMQILRLRAIRKGQVPAHSVALREPNWPARLTQISNAYHNQLETPLLFYVLILLAIITETAELDSFHLELAVRRLALRARLYPPHLQSPPGPRFGVSGRRHRLGADVGHRRRPPHHRRPVRMTPAARVSAAIEVLADIAQRKRPASEALKDWGLAHRFAGSGDRAAIGNLVFDALRHRASNVYVMQDDSPRALVLRTLVSNWGMTPDAVAALADGGRFAPEPLTPTELEGLQRAIPADAPAHIRGDYPEWLEPLFARAFGDNAAEEGAALSSARASRSPHQHAESHAREGAECASPRRCRADALVAGRCPHRRGQGPEPQPACRGRARARQRLVRGAGRGLASRHAARRGQAERAGARPLRRRRRQDAGARGHHREYRPDLCL